MLKERISYGRFCKCHYIKRGVKRLRGLQAGQCEFLCPEGSVCGFIGQNGAGKTTTIRIILDAINRDGGEVYVFGKSMDKDSAAVREEIGVVFDEMGFHDFLSAAQINTIMKNIYKNWNQEKYFNYLKRFSLPAKKACRSFSRGMRMKLQIFREFVVEEDHTILLSSHITGDLEKLADEVVFIDGGKIILQGNKDELLEKHGILRCKKDEVEIINKDLVVSAEISSLGAEVLVNDRKAAEKMYPQMIVEPAGLEEIMIHYVNRAKGYQIPQKAAQK